MGPAFGAGAREGEEGNQSPILERGQDRLFLVRIIHADQGATVAVERNLTATYFVDRPLAAHVRAMDSAWKKASSQHPGSVATIVIAGETTWVPEFSEDFRRATTAFVARTEAGSVGSAFVLSGNGLLNSALRAFISGVFLLSRSREPYRVFQEPGLAAEWISGVASVGVEWSRDDVLRVITGVMESRSSPRAR